jgi:hypothetical protein
VGYVARTRPTWTCRARKVGKEEIMDKAAFKLTVAQEILSAAKAQN